jgi:hypothetical protein
MKDHLMLTAGIISSDPPAQVRRRTWDTFTPRQAKERRKRREQRKQAQRSQRRNRT